MNLKRIEVTLADLQKQAAAIQESLKALAEEVETAKAQKDEFSAHIYRARLSYRRVADSDQNKGQKRTERETQASFVKAMELGFRGSMHDWTQLLRAAPVRKLSPPGS